MVCIISMDWIGYLEFGLMMYVVCALLFVVLIAFASTNLFF